MKTNFILHKFLKIFNREKYKKIKFDLKNKEKYKIYKESTERKIIEITNNIKTFKEINILHSGHLGDIIYSLPLIEEISKKSKCNFYININKKMSQYYHAHPGNGVYINERMAKMLIPLLEKQNYLNKVEIFSNQKIHLNLDIFREMPINISFNLSNIYEVLTGVKFNLNKPVLNVDKTPGFENKIIISRTKRYRNQFLDYSFLKSYENKIFLGLEEEFNDLKKIIPNIEFYECKDFLEMAKIINTCKIFIGNQSFGFALAESLKVKRLLELYPELPNVLPSTDNSYICMHQIQFENFFKELIKN